MNVIVIIGVKYMKNDNEVYLFWIIMKMIMNSIMKMIIK